MGFQVDFFGKEPQKYSVGELAAYPEEKRGFRVMNLGLV